MTTTAPLLEVASLTMRFQGITALDSVSFSMAVKREPDESILFSWITWPSKEVRISAWEKLMQLPEMQPGASSMPFDGKRMIYGGFDVILEL